MCALDDQTRPTPAEPHADPLPDSLPETQPESLADPGDLELAYRRHAGAVATVARGVLSDPGAVADVVQETFFRAWRQRELFDPAIGPLRPWLFAIARAAAIDLVRSRAARPWHQRIVDPTLLGRGRGRRDDVHRDDGERVLERWVLEEEIRRLPAAHRVVVVETQLRDRPHAEVAADLGIPVGTVRSRLFHALRMMRASLEGQEGAQ